MDGDKRKRDGDEPESNAVKRSAVDNNNKPAYNSHGYLTEGGKSFVDCVSWLQWENSVLQTQFSIHKQYYSCSSVPVFTLFHFVLNIYIAYTPLYTGKLKQSEISVFKTHFSGCIYTHTVLSNVSCCLHI